MKAIQDSPEHHFLTLLDKIKQDAEGWLGYRFALSEKLLHADIIAQPDHIKGLLHKLRKESETVAADLQDRLKESSTAMLYCFSDSDLILLVRPGSESERDIVQNAFKAGAEKMDKKLCTQANLARDIHAWQKLADQRFLSATKVKAYEAMADANRVQSIPLRRERREDAVVLIVEDDRFTASYASTLLNKTYDIVVAKTGEEAIAFYIDHAPDVVLLDIHLPGLNGLDTLKALHKIDPKGFVIMLSVDTVKQNIVEANKEGAAGFLKKPFGKERLLAVVGKSPYVKELRRKSGI